MESKHQKPITKNRLALTKSKGNFIQMALYRHLTTSQARPKTNFANASPCLRSVLGFYFLADHQTRSKLQQQKGDFVLRQQQQQDKHCDTLHLQQRKGNFYLAAAAAAKSSLR